MDNYTVEVCTDYWKQQGQGCKDVTCTGVHLCKFLLTYKCKSDKCIFSHSLNDQHHQQILGLTGAKDVSIGQLISAYEELEQEKVYREKLPEICKFYNGVNSKGCKHNNGESVCPCLHICKHYIAGDCRFNKSCRLSHNMMAEEIIACLKPKGIKLNSSLDKMRIINQLKDRMIDNRYITLHIKEVIPKMNNFTSFQEDHRKYFNHYDSQERRRNHDLPPPHGNYPVFPPGPLHYNDMDERKVHQSRIMELKRDRHISYPDQDFRRNFQEFSAPIRRENMHHDPGFHNRNYDNNLDFQRENNDHNSLQELQKLKKVDEDLSRLIRMARNEVDNSNHERNSFQHNERNHSRSRYRSRSRSPTRSHPPMNWLDNNRNGHTSSRYNRVDRHRENREGSRKSHDSYLWNSRSPGRKSDKNNSRYQRK